MLMILQVFEEFQLIDSMWSRFNVVQCEVRIFQYFQWPLMQGEAACGLLRHKLTVFNARCYAESGIAMASRLSVCLSVCDIEVLWS